MIDKKKLPKPAIMNPNYISLPSEWDSSVSQLEMLQRMLWNINQIIGVMGAFADETNELADKLQETLDALTETVVQTVEQYFSMKTVYFGLTDAGYFVAYIPEAWDDIVFNTTEYDIVLALQPEFGHLVLSFDVDD